MELNHMSDWFDEEYLTIIGLHYAENDNVLDIKDYEKEDLDEKDVEPIDWRNL